MERQIAFWYSKFVFATFLFLTSATLFAAITTPDVEQTSRFRVTNYCNEALWVQQDYKNPTQDPNVVEIAPGLSYDYNIPDKGLASTRFWPKKGCNEHGYNCKVGESTAVPAAEANGWQKPPYAPDINSKFEATWGCVDAIFNNNPGFCAANPSDPGHNLGRETWWNGSAVDGYTLPYAVNVLNHQNTCLDIHSGQVLTDPGVTCGGLKPSLCPSDANLSTEGQYNVVNGVNITNVNLQWIDQATGEPVGCFSPCAKLTTAQGSDGGSSAGGWKHILGGLNPESPEAQMYCCPTPPISSGQCSAGPAARSSYAQSINHVQNCNSYTYAYDDAKGLARCGPQTKFELIFCPKDKQEPSKSTLKFIIPEGVEARYDNQPVTNNQNVDILSGGVVSIAGTSPAACTLKVDTNKQVTVDMGALCSELIIDNTNKSLTFPSTPPVPEKTFVMQFNYNPTFGVTAALNDVPVNNAEPIEASTVPQNSILKAFQANKSAACNLTITHDDVTRGSGELCLRLNIVKEGSEKIHVYLPADIPDMGAGSPPESPKYVVFGMDPSIYAEFLNQTVTNGSKIALNNLGNATQINLIAHQQNNSASCIIGKSGDDLSIVHDTGLLCSGGLVLQTQNNGDIFIGLPNPLPVAGGNGGDTKAIGLGIAAGMTVDVNNQTVRWDSHDKTVQFPQGQTVIKIHGNNGLIRECPITLSNDAFSWPNIPDCIGVVVNGDVMYFPAF